MEVFRPGCGSTRKTAETRRTESAGRHGVAGTGHRHRGVESGLPTGLNRSIAALLQRVGRAEHKRGGLPKGRLFPLSRDELVECLAALRCVRNGELDCLRIPEKPLDLLAKQIVACAACEDGRNKSSSTWCGPRIRIAI